MNEHILAGCRTVPLASYLKALGVLRLVSEQADPTARGWWKANRFHLKTQLDRGDLRQFFLEEYRPSPIIAPWNGRAGFLEGETDDGQVSDRAGAQLRRAYARTSARRFGKLRDAVDVFSALPIIQDLDAARAKAKTLKTDIGKRKPTDEEKKLMSEFEKGARLAKSKLRETIRAEAKEEQYAWLDVCIRLADQNANSPLLIAGGSDGSRDYGMAFGTALQRLFSFDSGAPKEEPTGNSWAASVFDEAAVLQNKDSFGHFNPGQGGYNATTGYKGDNPLNPWDIVLALEGAVLWSGGVTRRLDGTSDSSAASFPFSFDVTRAGAGQLSTFDQHGAPGELWCPVWNRSTGLGEIRSLFREGRLTIGKRAARTGLDAALAVATLGRSRGLSGFVRIGLYQSDAKMPHTAAPLGHYVVGSAHQAASLAFELADHQWIAALRREARGKPAPAALRQVVRALDDSLFEMTSSTAHTGHTQAVLIGLGAAGRLIATRPKLRETLLPPPRISRAWVEAADDGTVEFRLAAALACLRAPLPARARSPEDGAAVADALPGPRYGLPMRAHLGPLDPDKPLWNAERGEALAIWGSAGLVDNLCAVARLRLLELSRSGLDQVPFDGVIGVDSGEIGAFLDDSRGDRRLVDLLLGLAWVEPAQLSGKRRAAPLPFAYAALKPLFTPHSTLGRLEKNVPILPIPAPLPALLASGRVQDALRLGQERARSSGLPTPFLEPRGPQRTSRAPNILIGRRLLAALVIPVSDGVAAACLDQAYPSSYVESQDAA